MGMGAPSPRFDGFGRSHTGGVRQRIPPMIRARSVASDSAATRSIAPAGGFYGIVNDDTTPVSDQETIEKSRRIAPSCETRRDVSGASSELYGGGSALDLLKPECLRRLLIFAGSGDDLLDDLGRGVGVVLDVPLPARRQLTLGALVGVSGPPDCQPGGSAVAGA